MNKWLLLAALILFMAVSDGKTLVVDPSSQGHPATLSRAVSMASPGDEIIMMPDRYSGAIIDRRLTIIGSGNVVINGNGNSALVVNAPGCRLSNLLLEGSGSSPVVLLQSPDNVVDRCLVSGGSVGVQILGQNNTVRYCQVNSSLGIELDASKCTIIGEVFGGDKGIQIKKASDNLIQNCRFSTDNGLEMISSNMNRIERNNFSGIYFGITLTKSDRNWIAENQISGSFLSGVDLLESSNNNLSENSITECKVGISVRQSENNRLINNSCQKNERAGIYLNSSDGNQLMSNIISKNGNGILLSYSGKNRIAECIAIGNIYGISLRDCSQNVLKNNSLNDNDNNLRIDSISQLVPTLGCFVQDIDFSNTADGKPICYLVDAHDRNISGDYGFAGLVQCQNIMISNQSLSNSSAGVLLAGCNGCKVYNSTIQLSEMGVWLVNDKNCIIDKCRAEKCKIGMQAMSSDDCKLRANEATNCSESGFEIDNSGNLTLKECTARGNLQGFWIKNSRSCRVQESNATWNKEAGIELIGSPDCVLKDVDASQNKIGLSLSGSNGCQIFDCSASINARDGIDLLQLSNSQVNRCSASKNGQGIYIQSSKSLKISNNTLSSNTRQGLRMSSSTWCNVTDNRFIENEISGASLIDCRGNYFYHNTFINNGMQNAVDNGENQWDGGPIAGGNYWSDHKVEGNPGNVPRQIQTKGVDRYPFQDPEAWKT